MAILPDEPEAASCARAIERAATRRLSAVNFVEVVVVIDGSRDPIASRRFGDLLKEAQVLIEPVTENQARLARDAYRDFGKGSGRRAGLNFGDCFAYALAKITGEPLLFKSADFWPHGHLAGDRVKQVLSLLGHSLAHPCATVFADRTGTPNTAVAAERKICTRYAEPDYATMGP